MNIKNLRYWVFTSGENGIHGLDWGVKHASEYFADRQKLDNDYRALLQNFGLAPSLERPANEVGLILLHWKGEDFIAGFIFSGTDHGDRPNTSSVICVIPSELIGRKSINELIRDIWTKNNITEIARKNSQERPDTLRLEGDSVFIENIPSFKNSVSWPNYYNGCLQIDGKQRELLSVNAPHLTGENKISEVKKSSGWKLKIFLVLMVAAVSCVAGKYFIASSSNKEVPTPPRNESPKIITISKDHVQERESNKLPTSNDNRSAKEEEEERKINELRKKLALLLEDGKLAGKDKSFKVRLPDWNNDKEKLFNECSKLFDECSELKLQSISLKSAGSKGKFIEFSLRSWISEDATKDITVFLNQIITKETI